VVWAAIKIAMFYPRKKICVDAAGHDFSLITNDSLYTRITMGNWPSGYSNIFELSPDESGCKNAQSIIDALGLWIQQVKSTQ
jgi:hypothetical protein